MPFYLVTKTVDDKKFSIIAAFYDNRDAEKLVKELSAKDEELKKWARICHECAINDYELFRARECGLFDKDKCKLFKNAARVKKVEYKIQEIKCDGEEKC